MRLFLRLFLRVLFRADTGTETAGRDMLGAAAPAPPAAANVFRAAAGAAEAAEAAAGVVLNIFLSFSIRTLRRFAFALKFAVRPRIVRASARFWL